MLLSQQTILLYHCTYSIWYALAEAVEIAGRRYENERLLECAGLPSARLPAGRSCGTCELGLDSRWRAELR